MVSLRDGGKGAASNVCLPRLGLGTGKVAAPLTNRASAIGGQGGKRNDISADWVGI